MFLIVSSFNFVRFNKPDADWELYPTRTVTEIENLNNLILKSLSSTCAMPAAATDQNTHLVRKT